MAIAFVGASTQYLSNSAPPAFAYPFTVGLWVKHTNVGSTTTMWSWADTGSTTEYCGIWQVSGGSVQVRINTGATLGAITLAGSASLWTFVLARFISATNRRASSYVLGNAIAHGNNATNITPTGIDTMALGAHVTSSVSQALTGSIAEFWWASSDVQNDGAQADNALVYQLATRGPFSVPHIAPNIVEYHSFRRSIDLYGDLRRESYFGPQGRQVWSPTNSPTTASHVPLPAQYATPLGSRNLFRDYSAETLFGRANAANRNRRLLILG